MLRATEKLDRHGFGRRNPKQSRRTQTGSTVNQPDQEEPRSRAGRLLLTWGSLALAAAESICVAAVGLSGIRVVLGLASVLAAGAAGPAHGWHRDAIRIPLLTIGGIGALVNLLLLWNEERMRRNPAAAWRIKPFTKK